MRTVKELRLFLSRFDDDSHVIIFRDNEDQSIIIQTGNAEVGWFDREKVESDFVSTDDRNIIRGREIYEIL
jgi:hypothetical protein